MRNTGLFSYKELARMLYDNPLQYICLTGLIIIGSLLVGHVISFAAYWMEKKKKRVFKRSMKEVMGEN